MPDPNRDEHDIDETFPSDRELAAKYPQAQTRDEAVAAWRKDHAAEAARDQANADGDDWAQAKADAEPDHVRERRERLGELSRHPHTQLRAILSDLQSPAAQRADITTKYGALHSAVSRLVQVILTATPPPEDSEEQINEDFERQQQPPEGADEQKP